MNIKQIEKILIHSGIEQNEAKIEAKMFVKHFMGVNEVDLTLNPDLNCGCEDLLHAVNLRASTKKPIQHILGVAHFMGEDFVVNENVLIPRDETEILVRKAVELIEKKHKVENKEQKVLDIGTGSGCIACMIIKMLNGMSRDIKVLGVDISNDALKVALDNSSKLGLFNKAVFRKSDVFSNIRKEEKFDVIVSNPPYIPLKEKSGLQAEVGFDPDLALFAKDDDGIEFYDKIIKESPEYLNDNGYLIFELGIGQADKVKSLLEKQGFVSVEIQRDLARIDRVIWGRK